MTDAQLASELRQPHKFHATSDDPLQCVCGESVANTIHHKAMELQQPQPAPSADENVRTTVEQKTILLIGDGPDGVRFFTDADKSIVWGCSEDSLFVEITVMNASAEFGPMLPGVTRQLRAALTHPQPCPTCEKLIARILQIANRYQHEDGTPGPLANQWGWRDIAIALRLAAAEAAKEAK